MFDTFFTREVVWAGIGLEGTGFDKKRLPQNARKRMTSEMTKKGSPLDHSARTLVDKPVLCYTKGKE